MKRIIIVAAVLVALVPTLLIGFAMNYYTETIVKEEKLDALSETVHLMRSQLGDFYERLAAGLRAKTEDDSFKKLLDAEDESAKTDSVDLQDVRCVLMKPVCLPVLEGAIIDLDGEIILSTKPDEEGLKLNRTDLFQRIINGEGIYIDLISSDNSTDIAEVAVPILDSKGSTIGILKQNFDLSLLEVYLSSFNPEKTSYIFLIRKNGKIVFGQANGDRTILYNEYQDNNSLERLVSDFKADKQTRDKGFVEFENMGAKYLGAYEVIPSLSCIAVAAENQKKIFSSLSKVNAIFNGVLLIIIIFAICGYIFRDRNSAPLGKMNSTLKAIANGDLTARCNVTGTQELKELCNSINNLADGYQKNEKELRMYSRIDNLTHLPNRNTIYEVLDTFLYKHPNQALLLLDLDGFKDVNDNLGNDIGDRILMEVGDVLRGLPQHVCYPSRLGGAEFLVFITNWTAPKYPEKIADKIIGEIAGIRFIDEVHVNISSCIGIEYMDDERIDKNKLIKYASIAMHKARSIGRNSYFVHYPFMQRES